VQDLAREVPVVERLGHVEALVALQADQYGAGRRRDGLGEGGLAHAGIAFEEQWSAQPQREEAGRCQAVIGEVAGVAQGLRQGLGRVE
jgi:hypothetical protein